MNAAVHMLPRDMQETNEHYMGRKHIDRYLREVIETNPDVSAKVALGVDYLNQWLSQDYFESKQIRLNQIKQLDLRELVIKVFTGICYCQIPELFVSVTSQMASRLDFSERRDSIQTIAEIVAVLCYTDAFDITKEGPQDSMYITSRIPLPDELMQRIWRSQYLPPMVCEPDEVTGNYDNPHLTFNDSLILGRGNGHDGDLCLDVINIQNRIPLALSTEFLTNVEEVPNPSHELDSWEKQRLWHNFKLQSHENYQLMVNQGNRMFLTNKWDCRGRMYAQGYHITSQGSAYKKAMLSLAEEEYIDVPGQYRT